jgi:hypothetical protein
MIPAFLLIVNEQAATLPLNVQAPRADFPPWSSVEGLAMRPVDRLASLVFAALLHLRSPAAWARFIPLLPNPGR